MSIVGGLDGHRKQLTFDYVEQMTGRWERDRIASADRAHLAGRLARFDGMDGVAFAVEAGTGWRYVAEEMYVAGVTPHLAEPADTSVLRGPKRRAKTDLLTELAGRSRRRCVRGAAALARFRACDQRRGRAAGVVRVGGAAARLA